MNGINGCNKHTVKRRTSRLPPHVPRHLHQTHCSDVIMNAMASQITSLTTVYSTVYSGADQRKYESSASLAFLMGIHRWRTRGQWRRKWFHLMTSSCSARHQEKKPKQDHGHCRLARWMLMAPWHLHNTARYLVPNGSVPTWCISEYQL